MAGPFGFSFLPKDTGWERTADLQISAEPNIEEVYIICKLWTWILEMQLSTVCFSNKTEEKKEFILNKWWKCVRILAIEW